MPDSNKSLGDKIATVVAIVVGLFAGARLINQGKAAKKLPRLWRAIRGIAKLKLLQFEDMAASVKRESYRYLMKLSSFIRWTAFVSATLIIGGVAVKAELHSNVGHVLVAVGTMSFALLGLTLYVLSDGAAVIAFYGLVTFGSIFGKVASKVGVPVPEALTKEGLQDFREDVRQIMAATSVMTFTLLLVMIFPAWSTLGWMPVFWALAAVMLCIAVAAKMPMGTAMIVLFYGTTVLIAVASVIFIVDKLSGGALHFVGFQKWFGNINHSELLALFLIVVIPVTLLGLSVMSKDKDRTARLFYAAKFAGAAGAVLVGVLLYKGTISWKQLMGKKPPAAVTKAVDWVEGSPPKTDPAEPNSTPAPQETASDEGSYMDPPPAGSFQPPPVPAVAQPAPRTAPPRLREQPLPPLKKVQYEDANSAMEDLETVY